MPTDWSVGSAVIGQVGKEHPILLDAKGLSCYGAVKQAIMVFGAVTRVQAARCGV